jgi:aminomethyltransferase
LSALAALLPDGLRRPDPALETFPVRAGGLTVIELDGEDRVRIVDPHGGQVAEVTALGAPLGGVVHDGPATALRALADGPRPQSDVITPLIARGLAAHDARCARMLGPEDRAGAAVELVAQARTTLIVAAPGGRVVDGDTPASELQLFVRRARPRAREQVELPAPLAEPRLDFRVDRASALPYEVAEGEYIQVIDVRGRQCSDFLAFHAGRLQSGVERGLDATVTRTISGSAFPRPGLQGKFYDLDFNPLVEVVRDTVGRHDTFALACQAKYYEDLGYPGHVNCTDNFNRSLAGYGVTPRRGWEALNFFYNTAFDSDMQLVYDEPWSRPGDYVMLRAMSDLVCASSACPDDIDPSNGWEATDIHVRVYSPQNRFSVAIARRVSPDAEAVLTRQTAFHERTAALTQTFTEYRGYWLPERFDGTGAIAEYWACRERVAVMDLSPLRKWEVLGPDAEALLQLIVTRDVSRLAVGQVVYTAVCNEGGGMIDDATVFRLGQDNFRFVGGDDYDGIWLEQVAAERGLHVNVKPATEQLHNLAVQGPLSRETLAALIWTAPTQPALPDLKWFRFLVGRIGGPQGIPVIVSRTGYTGELGYEVFCHPSDGEAVWDAIWAAGEPRGIAPLGLEALDLVRIEAGLVFAGHEFDDQVDPFEAGIGFTVALDGPEFIGQSALRERAAHPRRRLAGLRLEGQELAGHGDELYIGRRRVGVVTSGMRSPGLGASIALCRIDVACAEPGTAVEVGKLDGLRKRLQATVVTIPFYDPGKERPRS